MWISKKSSTWASHHRSQWGRGSQPVLSGRPGRPRRLSSRRRGIAPRTRRPARTSASPAPPGTRAEEAIRQARRGRLVPIAPTVAIKEGIVLQRRHHERPTIVAIEDRLHRPAREPTQQVAAGPEIADRASRRDERLDGAEREREQARLGAFPSVIRTGHVKQTPTSKDTRRRVRIPSRNPSLKEPRRVSVRRSYAIYQHWRRATTDLSEIRVSGQETRSRCSATVEKAKHAGHATFSRQLDDGWSRPLQVKGIDQDQPGKGGRRVEGRGGVR